MAEKHILSAGHLTIGYYGKPVLTDVSLEVESGEVLCLLGPNGVGKSTLFKSVLGLIPLIKGDVTVDGKNAKDLPRKEFAQHVAYVPQNHTPPFAFSVMDMVLTGCVSRLKPFETPGKKEYEQAEAILDDLSIGHLRDRVFTQLSGGEAQMTLIARALMQDSNILLMD
jgi:iron complex transport system ATP-binding protein